MQKTGPGKRHKVPGPHFRETDRRSGHFRTRLPWDRYKRAKYGRDTIALIEELCGKYEVPFDLMSKLMIAVDNSKFYTRTAVAAKDVQRILNEGWLHFDQIQEGLRNENQSN